MKRFCRSVLVKMKNALLGGAEKKYLLAGSVVCVENPKDFFGEVVKDYYVIKTVDFEFSLTPSKEYVSVWLNEGQLENAMKRARPWTLKDAFKLKIKRVVLPLLMSKAELDDYQFSI